MKMTIKTQPVKPVKPKRTFHFEMTEKEAVNFALLLGASCGRDFAETTNEYWHTKLNHTDFDFLGCEIYSPLKVEVQEQINKIAKIRV
jgi:hypothetical protein